MDAFLPAPAGGRGKHFRRDQRRRAHKLFQRIDRPAGVQEVARVTLRWHGQLDDANLGSHAEQRTGDVVRVLAPGFVVVGHDRHPAAPQRLAVLAAPLAGAARVARRDESERGQAVGVLLTFGHEHQAARIGLAELHQAI